MYSDINNKEQINAVLLLKSMSEHKKVNKVNKELKDSRDNDDNNQPLMQKVIIPDDINDIQPRSTQVQNCYKDGFDPNIIWNMIICTYYLFQSELVWKVKTGEQ